MRPPVGGERPRLPRGKAVARFKWAIAEAEDLAAMEPSTSTRNDHSNGGPSMELSELIRSVLSDHGRLTGDVAVLSDTADLHEAGLSSHATVAVMVAIEDALDIEFPDRMLNRRTFESIEALRASVDSLIVSP